MRTHLHLLAALFASSVATSQTLVGPAGSGAAFNEIQPAIDAASAGDTIYVSPGTYLPFQLSKPLRLIGAGPESVLVEDPSLSTCWMGFSAAEITDLPANSQTIVAGMSMRGPAPASVFQSCYCLRADGNQGVLVLHNLEIETPQAAVDLYQNEFVVVSNSVFAAEYPAGVAVTGLWQQGAGMRVLDSNAWITDSELRGLGQTGLDEPIFGFPGLHVINSNAYVARSSIHGGDGGVAAVGACAGHSGYPGAPGIIVAGGSFLQLAGDTADRVVAGEGADYGICSGAGAPAVLVNGAGFVIRSGGVAMVPSETQGIMEAEVHTPNGGTELTAQQPLPTLSQSVTNNYLTLKFRGEANWNVMLFASLGASTPIQFSDVQGAGALDPTQVLFLLPTVLDANGALDVVFPLPTSSALNGLSVYFQFLQKEPGADTKALSNLAATVLGS